MYVWRVKQYETVESDFIVMGSGVAGLTLVVVVGVVVLSIA